MIAEFLSKHYEFRVNSLRQETEWRVKRDENNCTPSNCCDVQNNNPSEDWQILDERTLNTIYIELLNAGLKVRMSSLKCYLYSGFIPSYHPFQNYFDDLPQWDGRDRVKALAHRVSCDRLWTEVFSIWLRAAVAQWVGKDMQTANSMVPVLYSERQGLGKSTFCRILLPPELRSYYLDKLDFTQAGEYDRMMAQFGLINLDEMDHFTSRAMAKFKSATQMTEIQNHSTRSSVISKSSRLASFIATTNRHDVLKDRTGSRRFFCVSVQKKIDCTRPINYSQLYAQILQEVKEGKPTWFNKTQERRIQENNSKFYELTDLQLAVLKIYRVPSDDEETKPLPASVIFQAVAKRYPQKVLGLRVCEFSKELKPLFRITKRKTSGYLYYAIPL